MKWKMRNELVWQVHFNLQDGGVQITADWISALEIENEF